MAGLPMYTAKSQSEPLPTASKQVQNTSITAGFSGTTLGKTNKRLPTPGLALWDQEKAYNLKNFPSKKEEEVWIKHIHRKDLKKPQNSQMD